MEKDGTFDVLPKKEVILKTQAIQKPQSKCINKNIRFNTEENIEQLESDKSDSEDNNFEIRRNTFHKPKKTINNEINLVQSIGDSLKLDFNSMMKKRLSNIGRKFAFESNNNIFLEKTPCSISFEDIKTEKISFKSNPYLLNFLNDFNFSF